MPSITFWTRLEPYTRLDDIDLGLQAQIHDPLWLLARQWQTGEFGGEDNGSPVQIRLRLERCPLVRFHPGSVNDGNNLAGLPYSAEVPLETLVEREAVQLPTDPRRDLRLAGEAGLYFLRLLERFGAPASYRRAVAGVAEYRLAAAADDPAAGQDYAGDGYLSVMSGRIPDGFLVYLAFRETLRPPDSSKSDIPASPPVSAAGRKSVRLAGLAYLDWFESRYSVPAPGVQTWNPERMEYAFSLSASATAVPGTPPGAAELALEAEEYHGGSLDWYACDLHPGLHLGISPDDPQPEPLTRTLIPSPLRYPGMASDRWWEFEDASVNLSHLQGDPDELLRLLLIQFALVYSNDWYIAPLDLSPGALFRPLSLVATDAFGQRTLIEHYSRKDPAPRDWRLFALSSTPGSSFGTSAPRSKDDLLFLPPVLASSLHGDPIEEVLIQRDELANLVWGVERLAPSLSGDALKRYELYHQRRGQAEPSIPEPGEPDELHYLLATTVPDHWIPFLPMRINDNLPDIRLRRAAALLDSPDGSPNGQPAFSRPLGRILEPEREDLSLFEEEAPRSGVRLVRQYQFTRWLGGGGFLWLARRKIPGAGEASSGLQFDQVK